MINIQIKFENFVFNKSKDGYDFTQEEKDLIKIDRRVDRRLDEVMKNNKKNPLRALINPKKILKATVKRKSTDDSKEKSIVLENDKESFESKD